MKRGNYGAQHGWRHRHPSRPPCDKHPRFEALYILVLPDGTRKAMCLDCTNLHLWDENERKKAREG